MKGVVVGVVAGLGVVILVWWYAGSSGKFSSRGKEEGAVFG